MTDAATRVGRMSSHPPRTPALPSSRTGNRPVTGTTWRLRRCAARRGRRPGAVSPRTSGPRATRTPRRAGRPADDAGLEPGELARVERLVKKATGAKELWVQSTPPACLAMSTCVQVVGKDEGQPRPHTDSRALCRYAAVLYLNPVVPSCGNQLLPAEPARRPTRRERGGGSAQQPGRRARYAVRGAGLLRRGPRGPAPLQPAAPLPRQPDAQRHRRPGSTMEDKRMTAGPGWRESAHRW